MNVFGSYTLVKWFLDLLLSGLLKGDLLVNMTFGFSLSHPLASSPSSFLV